MMSKTLDQWLAETEKYSGTYYEKYAAAWADFRCPESVRTYYCSVAKRYWDLRDLLQHIKSYGLPSRSNSTGVYIDPITPNKCAACKSNVTHTTNLMTTYNKYKKWICQAIEST